MRNIFFIFAIALSILMVSCNSVPDEIPEDLDASQLIQHGQDSYDAKRYKAAEKYFKTVLDRYGDDPKHFIEATYELGHLYMKTKQYEKAYRNFNDILTIYENVPFGLPGSYKKLSQLELKKIPQKEMDSIKANIANQESKAVQEEKSEIKEKEQQSVPQVKPLPIQLEEESSPQEESED